MPPPHYAGLKRNCDTSSPQWRKTPILQYTHRAEDQAASRWWEANPFASSSPSNHDVDSAAKDAIVHMPDCSPPTQTGRVIHILEVCCSFEHQNLENINQSYLRKLRKYEAIPAKLTNPGRQQSFPFSSADSPFLEEGDVNTLCSNV